MNYQHSEIKVLVFIMFMSVYRVCTNSLARWRIGSIVTALAVFVKHKWWSTALGVDDLSSRAMMEFRTAWTSFDHATIRLTSTWVIGVSCWWLRWWVSGGIGVPGGWWGCRDCGWCRGKCVVTCRKNKTKQNKNRIQLFGNVRFSKMYHVFSFPVCCISLDGIHKGHATYFKCNKQYKSVNRLLKSHYRCSFLYSKFEIFENYW